MIKISIGFYLLTALMLFLPSKHSFTMASAIVLSTALFFHALGLTNMVIMSDGINAGQINFNLFYSSAMTLWWIAIFFSFLMIKNNLKYIGTFLYFFIGLILTTLFLFPDNNPKLIDFDLAIHIFLSITAYSFLFLTFFQSIFLTIQGKALHNKNNLTLNLPPLETMRKLLFQLLFIGFLFLTLSLITGFIFLENLFSQQLVHKTTLSIISWILFLTIIIGHRVVGWSSISVNKAIKIGFILLLLAYTGSKFVIEKIL